VPDEEKFYSEGNKEVEDFFIFLLTLVDLHGNL